MVHCVAGTRRIYWSQPIFDAPFKWRGCFASAGWLSCGMGSRRGWYSSAFGHVVFALEQRPAVALRPPVTSAPRRGDDGQGRGADTHGCASVPHRLRID